eukprot:TRINITY_DN14348_c0_g1_i1.p1 TRINITY_DN14348_c0_g1~~TRINITY_DN14348_c0_g1_i1.p1  ORF type:complete len:233 (+),score=29.32 TRINITY_DN14348_c0_g1_i1:117-815(+)
MCIRDRYDEKQSAYYIQDASSKFGTYMKVTDLELTTDLVLQMGNHFYEVISLQNEISSNQIKLIIQLEQSFNYQSNYQNKKYNLVFDNKENYSIFFGKSDEICKQFSILDIGLAPVHAKFQVKNGKIHIIDSDNKGVWLKLKPGVKYPIEDNSVFRFSSSKTFQFKFQMDNIPYDENFQLCQICYLNFYDGVLKDCNHVLCQECYDSFSKQLQGCPFCSCLLYTSPSPRDQA